MIDGAKEIWRALPPSAKIGAAFLAVFLVVGVIGALG
jgi:hypothetical protein